MAYALGLRAAAEQALRRFVRPNPVPLYSKTVAGIGFPRTFSSASPTIWAGGPRTDLHLRALALHKHAKPFSTQADTTDALDRPGDHEGYSESVHAK